MVGFNLKQVAEPVILDDQPTARILADLLTSVLAQPSDLSWAQAVSTRNAALNLLAGTALEEVSQTSQAVSEAMRRRVVEWVISQLPHGPVSPAEAAAAHSISVRSLHRLFSEGEGTFGDIIRSQRLERARQDLALTSATVQFIAARWGYADASQFCREFKRTYGMTTSEFRRQTSSTAKAP
jgi:AraC-like DNA-binding protein